MDITNNFAVLLIAFKLGLDNRGEVDQEMQNDVLKIVDTFGDGMTPLQFYKYLKKED